MDVEFQVLWNIEMFLGNVTDVMDVAVLLKHGRRGTDSMKYENVHTSICLRVNLVPVRLEFDPTIASSCIAAVRSNCLG